MKIGPCRIGYRTIKTSLAVMLCILIFQLTGRGTPMIACLTAVFTMREDMPSTFSFGKSRIIGNTFGGLLALLYFVIYHYFNYEFIVELLLVPLLVAIIIIASDATNNNAAIIGGVATLLIIILNVPEDQTFWYTFERILDTFIGTFVSIVVNRLWKQPPVKVVEEPIDYKEAYLVKEMENEQLQHQVDQLQNEHIHHIKKSVK